MSSREQRSKRYHVAGREAGQVWKVAYEGSWLVVMTLGESKACLILEKPSWVDRLYDWDIDKRDGWRRVA